MMTDETINWKQEAMRQNALLHDAISRAEKAEAKLAKAVDVLRFYADIDNHKAECVTNADVKNWKFPNVHIDEGAIARAVLAELEKTE
jgi:hypothetical protein